MLKKYQYQYLHSLDGGDVHISVIDGSAPDTLKFVHFFGASLPSGGRWKGSWGVETRYAVGPPDGAQGDQPRSCVKQHFSFSNTLFLFPVLQPLI